MTFDKDCTVYVLLKKVCDEMVLLPISERILDSNENSNETIFENQISEVTVSPSEGSIVALEDKVVLSIGIRLLAEKHMLEKGATVGGNFNRTYALYDSFVKKYGNNLQMGDVLFKLNCCVAFLPDFIHMNSFHYEPLVDLEGSKLAEYYRHFKALTEEQGNDHATSKNVP